MSRAIVYSLFGHGREKYANCFSFESYLGSMMLCLRFNRLVYPEWTTIVETDNGTYFAYKDLFDYLNQLKDFEYELNEENAELCKAMLWRLKPIYTREQGEYKYSHIICRDLDSLSTFREAQAVKVWVNGDRSLHAITDSTSHTIPMMGGMVGFKPNYFTGRMDIQDFNSLMSQNTFDLNNKGADQKFLNQVIYPQFSKMGDDSITQHYFKGHSNTWLSDFHTCDCWLYSWGHGHKEDCKENVDIGVDRELEETNEISEHIGAAGFNHQQTMKLVEKYKDRFRDLEGIEKQYPKIFWWHK